MDLPIRILGAAPDYPALLVDGAFGDEPFRGLQLSHWPGNQTPPALKHELSTGIALNFIALPEDDQARLAGPAEAIVNSHYDTDGTLALFALHNPEQATAHRGLMLEAAAAGDFFQWPSDQALALDAIVSGLSQSPASPLAGKLEGLGSLERWQACTEHLLQVLPTLLQGDTLAYAALWEPVLERARRDAKELEAAKTQQRPELGLQLWYSGSPGFAPGRHALFQASTQDRVLALGEQPGGCNVRLIESTLTWFDLPSRPTTCRPDLVTLAGALNRLEGTGIDSPAAWRAQPVDNASPELWFGEQEHAPFAEHHAGLGLSRLSVDQILGALERHLVAPES